LDTLGVFNAGPEEAPRKLPLEAVLHMLF